MLLSLRDKTAVIPVFSPFCRFSTEKKGWIGSKSILNTLVPKPPSSDFFLIFSLIFLRSSLGLFFGLFLWTFSLDFQEFCSKVSLRDKTKRQKKEKGQSRSTKTKKKRFLFPHDP
jgi:hypothetical protein